MILIIGYELFLRRHGLLVRLLTVLFGDVRVVHIRHIPTFEGGASPFWIQLLMQRLLLVIVAGMSILGEAEATMSGTMRCAVATKFGRVGAHIIASPVSYGGEGEEMEKESRYRTLQRMGNGRVLCN